METLQCTDLIVTRYGGEDESPEGGEVLFLADQAAFADTGPGAGVDLLEGFDEDTLAVRVRCGALTEEEEAEWVSRATYPASCPSGRLVVGSWFPDFYGPDAPYEHPPWSTEIAAPTNLAHVTVYTHLPFTAASCGFLSVMNDEESREYLPQKPWGTWCRESRPGQALPAWLVQQCIEYPGIDPGHESDWRAATPPEGRVIEVLLHLHSADSTPPGDATRELEMFPAGIPLNP